MSDRPRRRRRGGGRGLSRFAWAAIGGVILLLGANVALNVPELLRGETPTGGFLTERVVMASLFWIGVAAAAGLAAAGWWFASEAYARSERPWAMWMRRAFLLVPSSLVVLLIVVFDPEVFGRDVFAIVVAFVLAAQLAPFVWAAKLASERRSSGRGASGKRSGGGRSSGEADGAGSDAGEASGRPAAEVDA